MSQRLLNVIVQILIMLFGVSYLISINSSRPIIETNEKAIGPEYFPNLLGTLLIVFAFISLVSSLRKADQKIDFPYWKQIVFTIGVTVLYFALWKTFGFFYVLTFLYLLVLLTAYRYDKERIRKILAVNGAISLIATIFIYMIFGMFMSVGF